MGQAKRSVNRPVAAGALSLAQEAIEADFLPATSGQGSKS